MSLPNERLNVRQVAGIVLCGGKSSRMGTSKAWLPFGVEQMLPRVVRILLEVVDPVVVVAAKDQSLPPLPMNAYLVHDEREAQGPLEGLRRGLEALAARNKLSRGGPVIPAAAAFATSCDVPLLRPEFVRRMVEELGDASIAVPVDGQFHHPLAAVYRLEVLPHIEALLNADRHRPVYLFDEAPTKHVPVEQLRDVDPQLESLRNLNHLEDYKQAVADYVAAARRRISVEDTSARNSDSGT